MLHFLLKYSLEFQNKIRVEPDKDVFHEGQWWVLWWHEGKAERHVGRLTDCLWNGIEPSVLFYDLKSSWLELKPSYILFSIFPAECTTSNTTVLWERHRLKESMWWFTYTNVYIVVVRNSELAVSTTATAAGKQKRCLSCFLFLSSTLSKSKGSGAWKNELCAWICVRLMQSGLILNKAQEPL